MIEYKLQEGALPAYYFEVLRSKNCTALIEGNIYYDDAIEVCLNDANLCNFAFYMKNDQSALLSSFRETLSRIRKIAEALIKCEKYLIDERDVSLSLEDIYFDEESGKAKLMLKPGGKEAGEALIALCLDIFEKFPFTNADVIASRIKDAKLKGINTPKMILKFLVAWEFELNR